MNNLGKDPRLDSLNKKIMEYNQLLSKPDNSINKKLKIHLLEEIDFMGDRLKTMESDLSKASGGARNNLMSMRAWKGVAEELHTYVQSARYSLPTDLNLISLNGTGGVLPTVAQWQETNTQTGFFSRNQVSPQALTVAPLLKELNALKLQPEGTTKIDYFYKLKQFKQILLEKSAFELKTPADISNFRQLVSQVDSEIFATLNSDPDLQKRYTSQKKYAASVFAQQVASSSLEDRDYLATSLHTNSKRYKPELMVPLKQRFDSLNQYDIKLLGSANNINWLVTNEESGDKYVMQLQDPVANASCLDRLYQSPINKYFATEYATIIPQDLPFHLFVTEYATNGDLSSERRNTLENKNDQAITVQATNRIGQLTSFCQELLTHNSFHSDIKLGNFLVDAEGKLMVSDKKGLVLDALNNGIFVLGSTASAVTGPFLPPEWGPGARMNVEAFMSYQIGLSLYDYVIAPEMPINPGDKLWCVEKPLNFDKPFFKSSEYGQRMQTLITAMTDPNPDHRTKLAAVKQELSALSVLANQEMLQKPHVDKPEGEALPHATLLIPPIVSEKQKFIDISCAFNLQVQQEKLSDNQQRILSDFEASLEGSSCVEQLQETIEAFKSSDKYSELEKFQSAAAGKTAPIDMVEEIIAQAMKDVAKPQPSTSP